MLSISSCFSNIVTKQKHHDSRRFENKTDFFPEKKQYFMPKNHQTWDCTVWKKHIWPDFVLHFFDAGNFSSTSTKWAPHYLKMGNRAYNPQERSYGPLLPSVKELIFNLIFSPSVCSRTSCWLSTHFDDILIIHHNPSPHGKARPGTFLLQVWQCLQWYCWWKKSCTTWDLGCIKPGKNLDKLFINWLVCFLPSTVLLMEELLLNLC